MSRRTERIASFIQQELGMMILRDLADPRITGLPSVTRVEVTEDLALANVYVSVMGTEGKQTAAINALRHSAGLMRTQLTKIMSMRQVPYLKFHLDENLKKEMAVLETLRQVALEWEERERELAQKQKEAAGGQSGAAVDQKSGEQDKQG